MNYMLFIISILTQNVESAYYLKPCNSTSSTQIFNLCIYDNGEEHMTTFSNGGYQVILKVDSAPIIVNTMDFTFDYINVVTSYIRVNGQMSVQHELKNLGATIKIVSLAVHADSKVKEMDTVPVYKILPMKGFRLSHEIYDFSIVFKNIFTDRPPVDTLWCGFYKNREENNNYWKNSTISEYTTGDSGLAYSWQNYIINPYSTIKFTSFYELIKKPKPTQTPSKKFTPRKKFTPSKIFTKSRLFTQSNDFSQSKKFSKSVAFSESNKFSKSNFFLPSKKFTASYSFSKSNIFLNEQIPVSPRKKGVNLVTIISVVIGIIVVAAITALVILFVIKKNKNVKNESNENHSNETKSESSKNANEAKSESTLDINDSDKDIEFWL